MTGTTNGLTQFDVGDNLGQSSTVQAVVDEFGAADLAKTAADYDVETQLAYAAPGNFINAYVFGPGSPESVTTNPAADAAASPVTYVSRSTTAPFVLLQGSQDHIISPSQSLLMLKALRAKGIDATRYVLWGADHGDLSFLGGDPATGLPWSTVETMGKITGFLGQKLGC